MTNSCLLCQCQFGFSTVIQHKVDKLIKLIQVPLYKPSRSACEAILRIAKSIMLGTVATLQTPPRRNTWRAADAIACGRKFKGEACRSCARNHKNCQGEVAVSIVHLYK